MENRELLDAATRGEWMLEHDKKVLEIMQNIASKIEKRAVNTKTNINSMVLSLDETRVKMSNLTRISDVKNAVYCENLITDDHTLPLTSSDAIVPQKNSVKESAEIAISNGIKLMENCFEKHKLKFDPSSSRSEETIVYRPIDQFYSPLPYLIGSDKWKDKWHLGLMENEDRQSQAGSVYADSVDSSVTSKPLEQVVAQSVNLSSSQDSLAKSINSLGDQMVINSKQGGLFDEPILSSEPTSSKLQPVPRNIVNFFDDEPPEMSSSDPSPLVRRKPTNLFDDVESVDSMPIYEPEINQEKQEQQNLPLPPVDLFNDNDFDNFITKMEKNRNQTPNIEAVNESKPFREEKVVESKSREVNVQRDMKSIAEEISKKVQLKKVDPENMPVKKIIEDDKMKKTEIPPLKICSPKVVDNSKKITPKNELKPAQEIKKEIKDEIKPAQNKSKTRITNLFDDEDDSEDFFQEIMKQKSSNTPKDTTKIVEPVKKNPEKKVSNLFDDSEEEDNFDNIFKEKVQNSTPKVRAINPIKESLASKTSTSLFENESNVTKIAPISSKEKTETSSTAVKTKAKKLFDDDSDNDENDNLFKSNSMHASQVGRTSKNDEYETLANKLDNSRAEHSKLEEIQEKPLNENIVDTPSKSRVIDIEENELPKTEIIAKETKVIDVSQQFEVFIPVDSALPEDDFSSPVISDDKTLSIDNNEISDEIEIESPNLEAMSLSLQIDAENEQKISINESVVNSSFTMPLFSDEPPDDTWDEEFNNFEEPETKTLDAHSTFSPNTSSYSVPLFDEFPPEDFDDDRKNPPPIPDFDDELSDYEDKKESQLEVPQINEEKHENTETIKAEKVVEGDSNLHIVAIDKEITITRGKPELSIQKIENKSITLDRTEIIKEKDDNLPDVLNTSIKSKLDMFSRSPETNPIKQSEPKKIPGKLNTNLNINVGALMPGARISLKKPLVEEESIDFLESSAPIQPQQSSTTSSGLLNNDMTKTRAKVSVKRRPSTRTGRRSNYEKSIDSQITDSDESKRDDASVFQNNSSNVEPPSKNLSDSIFVEENEEEFLPTLLIKKLDQSTTQKPPPVTTSKISVFYDDEAETKKMLDEQKLSKETFKKEPLKLFDELNDGDNFFGKINAPISKKLSTSISKQKPKQEEEKKSLFDDDNDEDDLFGTKTKIQPIKSREVQSKIIKSKPLFDDDDEELFGASSQDKKSIKKAIPSTKSLFGDESDDDDLFSVKPKSTQSKVTTAKLTATTSNKNQKTVEDDPLKDLMGN